MTGIKRFGLRFISIGIVALLLLVLQPAAAAEGVVEMPLKNFANGTKQGFEARAGSETLTVTSDESHSEGKSLLVSGRSQSWHGPVLDVTFYIEEGMQYTVTAWVLPKTPDSSTFKLSTQLGQGDGAEYWDLDAKTVSKADGWTQLQGRFTYTALPDGGAFIYLSNDIPDAEFYIDDISLIPASGGGVLASIQLPSLHEIYKDYFLFGTAFSANDLSGTRFELVKRHFNAMTAGNAMKPDALGRSQNDYNFTSIDKQIQTIEDAGLVTHGHTLVWHTQSALWLNKGEGGEPLTRAEAKANLEAYITTVAGHFAGRVISWDVVNEAFQSSGGAVEWRDALRKSTGGGEASAWYAAYENGADKDAGESGADYIYDAFVFARLADPNAVLYFNDFNETEKGKCDAIAEMTEELNEQWKSDERNTQPDRLLIEGIGMQAHYWTDDLNVQSVEDSIVRFLETGAIISVSELDIPAGNWRTYKELTAEEEYKQATFYAQLFQIYKKYADGIERVSIWGIDDPTSWRSAGSPLLFDDNMGAKLAYYAVADPDGFLAGNYDNITTQSLGEDTATPGTAPDADSTAPQPTDENTSDNAAAPTPSSDGDGDSTVPVMPIVLGCVAGVAVITVLVIFLLKRKK